jgi:hypothetical protein
MPDARGVPLRVAVPSDEVQVDPAVRTPALAGHGLGSSIALPQRIMVAMLDPLGVPHVYLTPAFTEATRIRRLYTRRDTHGNRNGVELVARELDAWLAPEVARLGTVRQ